LHFVFHIVIHLSFIYVPNVHHISPISVLYTVYKNLEILVNNSGEKYMPLPYLEGNFFV